jgi:hypothetical protein
LVQLSLTGEHEVALEVFINGTVRKLGQFLADAEVNQREFEFAVLGLARADILRLQITVRVTQTMQDLERFD